MTTRRYSTEASWVYTEYRTGERELYDLTRDRHQLSNLAADPRYADRVSDLHALLHTEVIEPDGVTWIR